MGAVRNPFSFATMRGVPVVPSMSITAWLPSEALKARTAGRAVARSAALAIRFRA